MKRRKYLPSENGDAGYGPWFCDDGDDDYGSSSVMTKEITIIGGEMHRRNGGIIRYTCH